MTKRLARITRDDRGLAVVEYAMAAVAAAAFAALLFSLIKGGGVSDLLFNVLKKALEYSIG